MKYNITKPMVFLRASGILESTCNSGCESCSTSTQLVRGDEVVLSQKGTLVKTENKNVIQVYHFLYNRDSQVDTGPIQRFYPGWEHRQHLQDSGVVLDGVRRPYNVTISKIREALALDSSDMIDHIKDMCTEVLNMPESIEGRLKAARWIGWMLAQMETLGYWNNEVSRELVRKDVYLQND